jgi:hypothetical protein
MMTTPSKGEAENPARMTTTLLKQEAQGMSALALTTLGKLMRGKGQDSVKLAAAREVLDRGHGKPKSGAPKAKAKPPKAPAEGGMTVIVKRFTDITPEEQAAADETERLEW